MLLIADHGIGIGRWNDGAIGRWCWTLCHFSHHPQSAPVSTWKVHQCKVQSAPVCTWTNASNHGSQTGNTAGWFFDLHSVDDYGGVADVDVDGIVGVDAADGDCVGGAADDDPML